MRIVSLLPSATEIVYALGLQDDLVAVTQECDYPPAAGTKPVVSRPRVADISDRPAAEIDALVREQMAAGTPLYILDDQRIRELRPDLILAQDLCRVCAVPSGQVEDALATLGCHADVLSLDPVSLDEVIAGIDAVGRATRHEEEATALTQPLRARVAAVADRVAGRPRRRVLALEWRDPPFSGGHWVPDMVQVAGGEALLSVAGEPSRRLRWNEVATAPPDVVVFMPCGYDLVGAVREAAGLERQPALAGAELFAVDASAFFSRPGPRIVDGVELLAWAIHPEVSPEPPPGTITRLA